jgi:hypothetical protein
MQTSSIVGGARWAGAILGALALAGVMASCATKSSKSGSSSAKKGPLVRGTWNGECNQFSAGDKSACRAIRAPKVTCQWFDDKVHMSVRFKNTFGAHVTVHMDPIYKLKNAGLHGNGLLTVKDVGLDPGEVRTYETDLDPKGVSGQPRITLCRPGVDVLQGVELG